MGWVILALVALWAAVLIGRAIAFRPQSEPPVEAQPVSVDADAAAAHLAELIRCRTVSYGDPQKAEPAEFESFRAKLAAFYPRVHAQCPLERIGANGLLYRWQGKAADAPTVLMAHYDVVPADQATWSRPPFDGLIQDGVLWGRGTLDTKSTLCGALEAAEALLAQGYTPKNDIYFAFGGDEEIMGDDAPSIVEALHARGIHPALVLDEGGAIVQNVFPGVKTPCALIGTGEKGSMNAEISVRSSGGHASTPPAKTPIGELAEAIRRIERKPFAPQLTPPARELFDTLGRHSTFAYRLLFANLWCFLPVLSALCKRMGGPLNALMRTTVAFTMLSGSPSPNVLPPNASVTANLRLLGGDTPESAIAHLERAASNAKIHCRSLQGNAASPASSSSSPAYDRVKSAIRQTWPGKLVSPYLMLACSDSRHFCRISENVLRFSPIAMTEEERNSIHGDDERIPVQKLGAIVDFYQRLLRMS